MFAYADKLFTSQPSPVEESCRAEANRQQRELILVPSESICFPECATAVAAGLGNCYPEGHADPRMSRAPRELARDGALFDAWNRRLSDARFYHGGGAATRVELLAKGYLAEALARLPGSPSAQQLHANVLVPSGAAARGAIFQALLEPGDTLLSFDHAHGGHVSHGDSANASGARYRVISYGVTEKSQGATHKLDYQHLREQAQRCRPKIIVGGSRGYPWDWDWKTLRSIANEVGALLIADVAELAGMIFGGVLNNPIPHAQVLTFTTHTTLCGPRGACMVTTCEHLARKIDHAVCSGQQGGPQTTSCFGIARLFEIICQHQNEFSHMQRKIVANAKVLSAALAAEGFMLAYGGTDTHQLLVDLKPFKTQGAGTRLDGATASRLLENVGIVCTKHTLPGDSHADSSSGVRFGTPWLTQRGVTEQQLRELAQIVKALLSAAHTFAVHVPTGDERCRARVPFDTLDGAQVRVHAIADELPFPCPDQKAEILTTAAHGFTAILVRGEKARRALDQSLTCDVLRLHEGHVAHGVLLRPDGRVLGDALVSFVGSTTPSASGPNGEEHFVLMVRRDVAVAVTRWLKALSDGYVLLNANDLGVKIDGPFSVERLPQERVPAALQEAARKLTEPVRSLENATAGMVAVTKSFFVGQNAERAHVQAPALKTYAYTPPGSPLKKTVLHGRHVALGAKKVPFGGWEMPVEYPTGIFAEHKAVRTAAGLFDVSHMSALEFSGPLALPFLETVCTHSAARLAPNEAQYSCMLYPDGTAVDDLYVYKIEAERYMVVVNAGNAERDIDWLKAVHEGACVIDSKNPAACAPGPAGFRTLRDAGQEALIDLAFQGPLSAVILAELAAHPEHKQRLHRSRLNACFDVTLKDIPVRVAHTGYTGETTGFELFVHPDRAGELWDMLLAQGQARGVLPCGLGARDSLRIEAGLPLFGHEIEGPEKISLSEADYGFVTRHHVPFYIGRDAYLARHAPRLRRLVRLQGSGRRSVRAGACVLDKEGKPCGVVTSFAFSDPAFTYHVLAVVHMKFAPKPGETVHVARATPEHLASGEALDESKIVPLTALTRFPALEEKQGWRVSYSQK